MLGNLTLMGTATSINLNTLNVDISDNIIGLNVGANSLSENFRDTGIIYERGTTQSNVFAGFTELSDLYVIGYTTDSSDFSGNNISISNYVNLRVNDLSFNNGSCNSLVINGTNISTALSTEAITRTSADSSLSTALSSEASSRISGDSSLSNGISTINNSFATTLQLNNLSVQGNTTVLGNLTVMGTTTSTTLDTLNFDISDNLIGLNVGAKSLSENFRDTGIIYERGSTQSNVFAGFTELSDLYVIGYTSNSSNFSGSNISISNYANLKVNNLLGSALTATSLSASSVTATSVIGDVVYGTTIRGVDVEVNTITVIELITAISAISARSISATSITATSISVSDLHITDRLWGLSVIGHVVHGTTIRGIEAQVSTLAVASAITASAITVSNISGTNIDIIANTIGGNGLPAAWFIVKDSYANLKTYPIYYSAYFNNLYPSTTPTPLTWNVTTNAVSVVPTEIILCGKCKIIVFVDKTSSATSLTFENLGYGTISGSVANGSILTSYYFRIYYKGRVLEL